MQFSCTLQAQISGNFRKSKVQRPMSTAVLCTLRFKPTVLFFRKALNGMLGHLYVQETIKRSSMTRKPIRPKWKPNVLIYIIFETNATEHQTKEKYIGCKKLRLKITF